MRNETRRTFLKTMGAAALATGLPLPAAAQRVKPRLGVDMYSLGAQNWTPFQSLDWAAAMNVNMLHFSEIRFLGSPDWQVALAPDNLRKVRARADELKIDLEIGMRSICPTSSDFNKALGTVDEQIARMLAAAKLLKSPIVRCVLGTQADRRTGIEKHIAETVRVLKENRSRIMDAGVKMAIENHAGDMQARELKGLIEAAGPEYVGVCLDSGNPVWMLEDPHMTLEMLIPYAETCHVRDSAVWKVPEGIAVRWVNMGDGNVDIDGWIRKFIEAKPGLPIIFENLVSGNPRVHRIYDQAFWANWSKMPAAELGRFLAIAERGTPKPATPRPPGKTAGQQRIEDLEVCVRYTRALLQRL